MDAWRHVLRSLGIIQDSKSDWDIEASKMAQIYNRSTLTISASRASSSDAGFLSHQNSSELGFVTIRHPRNLGNYYFGQSPPKNSSYLADVERGPLNTRGWTLQERLLSRRNIFFGRDQMHWECQTARFSQSSQMEPHEYTESTGGVSSLRSILNLSSGEWNNASIEEILGLWYEVLALFVKRDLTYGDDKLPALSGIVSVFDTALSGEGGPSYMAGVWKQDVARGLMWMVPSQEKRRVPSWSWSSVDSRVWLMRRMKEPVCDISDICFSVTPIGIAPFGRVEHATLRFKGLIRKVPRLEKRGDSFPAWDKEKEYLYPNALAKDEDEQVIGKVFLDEPWFEHEKHNADDQTVYCIQIRHNRSVSHGDGKAEALLVCRVSNDQNIYERVGLIETELVTPGWARDSANSSKPSSSKGAYEHFLQGAAIENILLR
jgi:hypothetical protein